MEGPIPQYWQGEFLPVPDLGQECIRAETPGTSDVRTLWNKDASPVV